MSIPRRLVSDDHGMRIGLKLDAGFDDDVVYRRLYGTEDVPRLLGDMGVEAVEIPLGPESDDAFVLAQARRCQAAGLTVSFHPYSEGTAIIARPAGATPRGRGSCDGLVGAATTGR